MPKARGRAGWRCRLTSTRTGMMDKVCVGTGQNKNVEFYLTRPTQKGNSHGQAPLLWCAVACFNRLPEQRSALGNPDFSFQFPPPRGGLRSLVRQGGIATPRNFRAFPELLS